MCKFSKFLLCFLSFSLSSLFAIEQESFENKQIEKIDVLIEQLDARSSIDSKPILAKMKTKAGSLFSQIAFDGDLKILSEEFDQVLPSLDLQKDKLFISIKIVPKSIIRNISWNGNKQSGTKTLQKELGIKPGGFFHRPDFHKALNKVKDFYIKKGFFEIEINYTTSKPDPKKNEIDIDISVKEGKSGNIQNIRFEGLTKEEESGLLEMIYTKKYNLFLSWMTGQGIYREDAMEQDQMTILNFFQNKGYADAKVQVKITTDPKTSKIILNIIVSKGLIFHYGKVSFEGNTLLNNTEVQNLFLIHPKDTFSPDKLRETAQAIKDAYGQKGYIEAQINFDTFLLEKEPIYNVDFHIEEGQCFKIGLIRITGNSHTENRVILREALLVPGETFDQRKIKATQERLENMGFFKNVNVYAVRASEDSGLGENFRDVHIEVEEQSTGTVSLSLGLSSLDNVFTSLDLTEKNFNYKGFGHFFSENMSALRGGGEYVHMQGMFGAKQKNGVFTWIDPYFRDTPWRVGFEGSVTTSHLQSKDYHIKTQGFSIFASYPLSAYWSLGTKYRLRNAHVYVNKKAGKDAIDEAEGSNLISAVSVNSSYDDTDNAYKAHRGARSLFDVEYAGVGGTSNFFKFNFINTVYQALWKKGTMKYRADFQFILPVGSTDPRKVPLSERFFLGGETSVRGFKPFILGPHFQKKKDPTGGISSVLISVEYSQQLLKVADAFIFADGGSVSLKEFRVHRFCASWGFGLRLELMSRVPFIFGMGFPVNPHNKADVQKFFFSMGGQF
ncbi:MAG: outer membrane protein assembly factor BamA [Chlamydiota bacterium]